MAFTPIILLCMLLVRLTSAGPALYGQTRLGKDLQSFRIYKIRTMYFDSEDLSGPVLCQPGDSRITPVGKVLRFLHLDELPQLINVVRGEMCLVGPRPERPEIIIKHRLREKVPGFNERTNVLPGVTGLAQVNLPADQTAECVIPKVQLDLEYIATAGSGLDLRILLCTAMRMAGIRNGRAVRLLGLQRSANADPHSKPHWADSVEPHGTVPLYSPIQSHAPQRATRIAMVVADNGGTSASGWTEPPHEHSNGSVKAEKAATVLPRKPR